MNRCSSFIKNKALFGSFPTQQAVEELEAAGVRHFIDLTRDSESKTTPYTTQYSFIKYPIHDRQIPIDWKSFAQLILKIGHIIRNLSNNELVYVHCKGGHGRSGIVVACLLCHLYGYTPTKALVKTSHYHSLRPEMREKWRIIGSPQTRRQKIFVEKFFRPLKFNRPHQDGYTMGMNNMSMHEVEVPGMGIFPSAHAAFQAFKDPENVEYINGLKTNNKVQFTQRENWETVKVNAMYTILLLKFQRHADIRRNLLNTGLRPIVKLSLDEFWGCKSIDEGQNMFGKLLCKVRDILLVKEMYKV